MGAASFWRALTRRKVVNIPARPSSSSTASTSSAGAAGADAADAAGASSLARVLTTLDLTALGVGSTLGVGVYVLAGSVARDFAGPAVVISFAVAAVASMLAGLCYAEFGARVPLAGSAYIYSYVSIGEFMAFVIGWNLIMEYVIGCASVARGLSNYLDQLMGNVMQESFQNLLHLHVSFLSPYIDFFAFGMSFLLSVILAFGVKESMSLNNLFTAVNMAVVLFVIVAGAFKADIANWQIEKSAIPPNVQGGDGGFFPFGFMGVLRGAATCFYGFIGFDCVATTGEEVKNPQRAIPIAIIVSLVVIFLSYFGVSAVLTLMWPYYLQDPDAPLPYVFEQIGWPAAQWTVAIGGIFGLFASLFGAMYPLPRVIYAMANDGLIFKFLGEVHPKYKTPLVGTLLAGVITGIMAALFKLQQLVNMLSIGTLVAYTMVAACVLLLRYRFAVDETADVQYEEGNEEAVSLLSDSERLTDDMYRHHESDDVGVSDYKETTNLVSLKDKPTISKLFAQIFNPRGLKTPTPVSSRLVSIEVILFCCLSVALGLCLVNWEYELMYGHWGPLLLVCVFSSLLLIVVLSMALQPSSRQELAFKVPWVPVIPAVSILLNIYLILMLDLNTWIRFAIWMAVGTGLFFISLACRKMNWCGSALTLDAPARKPGTLPLPNGNRSTNGSSVVIKDGEGFVCRQILGNDQSLPDNTWHDSISEDTCVLHFPHELKTENILISDDPSCHETSSVNSSAAGCCDFSVGVNSLEVVDCSFGSPGAPENSTLGTEAAASYEINESTGEEMEDGDRDSDLSITDVANDLLALTYPDDTVMKQTDGCLEGSEQVPGDCEERLSVDERVSTRRDVADANLCLDSTEVVNNSPASDFEDVGNAESQLNAEESDTEDVRSLYPDVVVISSSEEDLNSRRSSIIDTVRDEDIKSDVKAEDCLKNNILTNSQDENQLSNGEKKMESTASNPVVFVPITPIMHGAKKLDPSSEVVNTLRKSSFVERLEKIIGAQNPHCKPLLHPPIPLSSDTRITNSHNFASEISTADASSQPVLIGGSDNFDLASESTSVSLPEIPYPCQVQNETPCQVEPCTEWDGTNNADVVKDIKEKLEKIFSSKVNTPVTSPTSKVFPGKPVDAETSLGKPISENLEAAETNFAVNLDDNACEKKELAMQVDESKNNMALVLGSIRLRNPNISSC